MAVETMFIIMVVAVVIAYHVGKDSGKRNICKSCEEKAIHIGALSKEIEDLETSANENEVKIGVYERVHR
jgi:hypothetical protein